MLVILMENQLLPPDSVCQSCLMADRFGQPRWRDGQLRCGRRLQPVAPEDPVQYECQMGFRIAQVGS
ncbi:MAG: hypothetical protein F6J97_05645 [Leptolyngbya sp. SIO4C1]|nr:hypothetical protein [Leptolyngbya sp. SIO4C1]